MADVSTTVLDAFRVEALNAGFDEVLDRTWDAGAVVEPHAHPFDVRAIVTRGEMWLTCEGRTRHLLPGDRFELARDVEHAERYGAHGATYRVARRNTR